MKDLGTSSTASPHELRSDLPPEQVKPESAVGRCCRIGSAMLRLADQGEIDTQRKRTAILAANEGQAKLLDAAADISDEMLAALEWVLGNKWKSDKDNMEFTGTISCYQMDKIRAAIAKAKGAA